MERPDLAPFAARSQDSLGRKHQEAFKDHRPAFERDRDRIIHCAAFRRLEYKTQVFVNHEGDYYRTRLTHSLEVAQIARGIARRLHLNEDLAEALALAHDLGHTPFGHTGEEVLNELMSSYGGFEHNLQSLRIVDLLEERYADFNGLNLSYETREGIAKHSSEYDRPTDQALVEFDAGKQALLEAQIIDLADEIAYNNHDIDDGLESGFITVKDLEKVELWDTTWQKVGEKFPGIEEKRRARQTISHLIGYLIEDLVTTTAHNLQVQEVQSPGQVRDCKGPLVNLSVPVKKLNRELKTFLHDKLYRHYKVERMRLKAQLFLTRLFECYHANPTLLPGAYQERFELYGCERVICDYVAGMTDRYALDEYKRLFEPYERV